MKKSETINKIAIAILEAQKKIGSAKKGSKNPFFKSTYASLGDVMEACKEALNESNIAVLQPIGTDSFGVYVETILLHISGEWISDTMKIAPKTDINPQDQGSAISYARRYSLQSMVFIPAEDDDAEKITQKIKNNEEIVNIENKITNTEINPSSRCKTCGNISKQISGISTKNGKPYNGIFCNSKDISHTIWL